MTEAKKGKDDGKMTVYEVGFHVVPTLAEEEIPSLVSKVKSLIENLSGKLISEEAPKMKVLSYEITKLVSKQKYSKAYFGWVKFELGSTQIEELEKSLKKIDEILRFILVKTVRENTLYQPKFTRTRREGDESVEGVEIPKEISEEEIDKSIENLVIS